VPLVRRTASGPACGHVARQMRNADEMVPTELLRQDGDGWVAGMDTSVGCDPPLLSDAVEDGWIMKSGEAACRLSGLVC
jgi:hypothetical protein